MYAPRDMTENADSGSNINTLYPNLMPDVRCSTRAGGVGMKAMGWDDWLINTTLQFLIFIEEDMHHEYHQKFYKY